MELAGECNNPIVLLNDVSILIVRLDAIPVKLHSQPFDAGIPEFCKPGPEFPGRHEEEIAGIHALLQGIAAADRWQAQRGQ